MTEPNSMVIFGGSSFGQIALEYFTRDLGKEVIAFIVDTDYLEVRHLYGLPVFTLQEIANELDVRGLGFHVAVTYTRRNQLRLERIADLNALGMVPLSYVSPSAYVDATASMGDHIFVFENNTIQPFTQIEEGCVLWSGNHIGHHSTLRKGVFVSSHVVVSGHCEVGERSFLGVNSTIGNNVSVGRENWILPNTLLLDNTGDDEMWKPPRSQLASKRPSGRLL